jgi:hypothetical protein
VKWYLVWLQVAGDWENLDVYDPECAVCVCDVNEDNAIHQAKIMVAAFDTWIDGGVVNRIEDYTVLRITEAVVGELA